MNIKSALLCVFCLVSQTFAANPFLPLWEYIPDGEPRVFGDRVYLYGSHDKAGSKTFCDHQLRVWSAPLKDLNQWKDHGVSFSTRDIESHKDDVPWSDNELYAPDVIEKDGKYYLYAYVVGAPCAVGVSDDPGGPFKLISKIKAPPGADHEFGGWGQYIDPGVLVDDDGKVYIYWGYKSSHMARLDPRTMVDILPDTYQADIIPVTPPFNFFEGASPRKINGVYYLIYADGGILAYATSKSPTGPFEYGGPIIRQGRDCPGGNIHGSLANLNGKWHIFYHRMTHNTIMSRRACVEKVTIEPDGSIKEVEQTSLGFQDALDPFQTTPADIACVLKGRGHVVEEDRNTRPVIHINSGGVVGFKYFDFGTPPNQNGSGVMLSLRIRGGEVPGRVEILTGAWEGATANRIGEITIQPGPSKEWRTVSTRVKTPGGRQALYLRFVSDTPDKPVCDLLALRFNPVKS
jgi:arabinoxylan arabinofuranohydrolase